MKPFEIWHYSSVDLNAAGGIEKFILGLSNTFNSLNIKTHVGLNPPVFDESMRTKSLIIHTHGDCWPNISFLKNVKELKNVYQKVLWIHISHGNTIERMRSCNEYLSYSGYKGALRDFSLISMCDYNVAVSQHALNENIKYYKIKKRTCVISNGADTNIFKPLNAISSDSNFIFIGRSDDRVKNIDIILKSFSALFNSHSNIKLFLAPGIKENNLPFVHNLGLLKPSDIASKLATIKGVILSSLYEGDALILREAMAMGLPIIASDIIPNRETCAEYRNVFWFNPKDQSSLIKVIEDSFLNKNLSVKPMPRDWKTVSEEYLNFYSKILETNS